jgi:L-histidine N-alpha-methyltransferase
MSISVFVEDILDGLKSKPKHLSSKYFYDTRGSQIFQDIMRMDEYYLTDCEMEIFKLQTEEIFKAFSYSGPIFDLVELGAGDGLKTKVLLEYFLKQKANFSYKPIDISGDSVKNLTAELENIFPNLEIYGQIGDYFEMMEELSQKGLRRKILLFLGSNIGNFEKQDRVDFLIQLRKAMNENDLLFIGFDLKKDPKVISLAYNDPHGHTAAFNLNLLIRINREMSADFDVDKFKHEEIYNPETGSAKSYLRSLEDQKVHIKVIDETIFFEKGERIYMELSQKFDDSMIQDFASETGFEIVKNFNDSRNYYMNSLWQIKSKT